MLVEPKYNDVKFSGKGVYGVKIGGLWAILKGDELITDAVYDYVGDYSNGAVYVTKDDEVFYVDRRGRERKSR